jgi:hypothetical protein
MHTTSAPVLAPERMSKGTERRLPTDVAADTVVVTVAAAAAEANVAEVGRVLLYEALFFRNNDVGDNQTEYRELEPVVIPHLEKNSDVIDPNAVVMLLKNGKLDELLSGMVCELVEGKNNEEFLQAISLGHVNRRV